MEERWRQDKEINRWKGRNKRGEKGADREERSVSWSVEMVEKGRQRESKVERKR